MDDKWVRGVKNLKKRMTSFMDGPKDAKRHSDDSSFHHKTPLFFVPNVISSVSKVEEFYILKTHWHDTKFHLLNLFFLTKWKYTLCISIYVHNLSTYIIVLENAFLEIFRSFKLKWLNIMLYTVGLKDT